MTDTKVLTSENLTYEDVKAWDGRTMKHYMSGPLREAIYRVISEQSVVLAQPSQQADQGDLIVVPPQPTPEEQEAERLRLETEQQVQAETERQRLAAEQIRVAEEQRIATEAARPKKIVLDYQVTNEKGEKIGRPTHLEAANHEEMIEKMKEAHIQATRAFHRLKEQKVQSVHEVRQAPQAPAQQMTDAELLAAIKDLKSDDPTKALEAHRLLNKAEADRVQAEADAKVAKAEAEAKGKLVSYQFLTNHLTDYNNCEANNKMLHQYLQENELAWTVDNLDIAFHALEKELAPVVEPVVVLPANPVPVQPAIATPVVPPAAAPVVQPAPAAPIIPTPPANPAPAQPRPGVNGGIVPGQNSASRPSGDPKGLTTAEIHSWDGPTMRAKMRNPQLRAEIERVVAEDQARKRK
jgi:hypothetical protein